MEKEHPLYGIYRSADRCDCGKRPRLARKCLYLILDDLKKSWFSIHRIDPYSLKSDEDSEFGHLPEPALRLVASVNIKYLDVFVTALGSKLVITSCERAPIHEKKHAPSFVYATETGTLSMAGPRLPVPLHGGHRTALSVGEVVYVLSSHYGRDNCRQHHSFVVMSWTSMGGWSWESVPSPPFVPEELVISYALHPNEYTIFMSTRDVRLGHDKGTYSFDTKRNVWMWHGEWVFPFRGSGYFDHELGAWVGLHNDGFVCSSRITSMTETPTNLTQATCVIGKEKLFHKDQDMAHLSATLVCVGENKFCIIESVTHKGVETETRNGDTDVYMLHLTMFRPRYNEKGELETTTHHPTCTYVVPSYDGHLLEAFCM